jgi:hypothetical protein
MKAENFRENFDDAKVMFQWESGKKCLPLLMKSLCAKSLGCCKKGWLFAAKNERIILCNFRRNSAAVDEMKRWHITDKSVKQGRTFSTKFYLNGDGVALMITCFVFLLNEVMSFHLGLTFLTGWQKASQTYDDF